MILFQRARAEPVIMESMRRKHFALGTIVYALGFSGFAGFGCSTSDAGPRAGAHSAGMAGAAGSTASAGDGLGGEPSDHGSSNGGAISARGGAGSGVVGGDANANHAGSAGAPSGDSAGAGAAAGASTTSDACERPGLAWKSANKTNYTSYPEPGSDECVKFSGCMYEGLFAACDQKRSLDWVKSHNIVAAFPDLKTLELHDLCLKSGNKTIIVTVYDTCADSDCDGCCTANKGNQDELIDVESFTDARWGVPDGPIEWADLGPTQGTGCN